MIDLENLIKLALVTRNSDDSEHFPQFQIQYLNKVANASILLPYGLPSRPIPGETLCLVFNIQGQEENRIAIPLATTNRKKDLKDGEVALYNEATKGEVYLKENGDLVISVPKDLIQTSKNITITGEDANVTLANVTATADNIEITCPLSTFNGNVAITGQLAVEGAFGANGATPQTSIPVIPPATNLAQIGILVNQLRAALVDYGIVE